MRPAAKAVGWAVCVLAAATAARGAEAAARTANGERGGTDTIVPAQDRIDDPAARLLYAQSLSYRRATWPQAVAEFQRLLRAAPNEPDAVAGLGELYLWMNRPRETAALVEAAGRNRPLSAAEQRVMAEARVRLGAPAEGLAALRALVARTPHPSAELLNATAEASLAAGDVPGARAMYERAVQVDPTSAAARRGYALTLAWSGDADAAVPRLEALLNEAAKRREVQSGPDAESAAIQRPGAAAPAGQAGVDADVAHAYAEAVARRDGTDAAVAAVRARAQAAPASAEWRAEWADLEARRGHAVQARALFAEALARENTPALRLRAARAAVTWGDFNGAERVFRAAIEAETRDRKRETSDQGPQTRDQVNAEQSTVNSAAPAAAAALRDDMGRLLVSADRLEEAEQWYREWLADAPDNAAARLGFARLALKEKNFPVARVRARAAGALGGETVAEARPIEADALMGAQQWKDAAAIETALAAAAANDAEASRRAAADLALARIDRELHATTVAAAAVDAAQQAAPDDPAVLFAAAGAQAHSATFVGNVTADEPSAPRLVAWASGYEATGDYRSAIACLRAARAADPEYYPAQIQGAELLAIDGQYDAALRAYAELKQAMPDNRQVLLGEARTLAWSRRYDAALRAYAALAALNPADPVPQREAARTASWAKQRRRSAALYATAWTPQTVDAALAAGLREALPADAADPTVRRWAAWAAQPRPEAEPFAVTARFYHEQPMLDEALPAPARATVDQLALALQARFRIQRAWWLENAAKQAAWDRRYATAAREYRRLVVAEPGNEEAWFDLSQAEAAQGLGGGERTALTHLLVLDPNHSLALAAVRRRTLRSAPLGTVEARTWHERGRGDLASMERAALMATAQATLRDQYDVTAAAELGRESPLTRAGAYAYRAADLGANGVFNAAWSGSAAFQHREYYDARIGHSDTGRAQVWFKDDAYGLGAGFERRDEVANEWALFQGTQSDNIWLGGTAAVAGRFDLGARLTDTAYNDGNRGTDFVVQPAYAWTDHPRVFKTTLTLEYRDTRDTSLYFRDPAGRLRNLLHPYWTPQGYTHAAVTFEWYRDLARQYFVGSEANDYDLRLTLGTDSESNPAATFEAEWHREWRDRWVAFASLYVNRSREWDATGLRLRLSRRF